MSTPAKELNQEILDIAKTLRLPDTVHENPEYQKMVSGCDYQAWDPQLTEARAIAHDRVEDYNTMRIRDFGTLEEYGAAKLKAFGDLVGSSGKPGLVESPLRVDYGFNTKVGDNFYANFGLCILDCSLVVIGNNVMCAPNVSICTATHPINAKERITGCEFAHPIYIEDNVWIGAGAIILPGVRVGRNAVVAAGAVVSRDVAPNTIVAGVPAKKIRDIDNTNLDLDTPDLD